MGSGDCVVSCDTICIALLFAVLRGLQDFAADVRHAHLNADCRERYGTLLILALTRDKLRLLKRHFVD